MKLNFVAGSFTGLLLLLSANAYGETGEKAVIEKGKTVKIDFTLTVDGEMIDSTEEQGPFQYVHGESQIIPGLEKQLEGLEPGDEKEIIVGPEDGFGIVNPKAYVEIPKSRLPEGDFEIGMQLEASGPDGRRVPVIISEIKADSVILNFNHPLAGKELHFRVKVIEIL